MSDLAARLEEYIDDLRHNSERRSCPGFDTRTANTIASELEEIVEDVDAIELTDRQRERLDEIKAECTGEGLGELPEPSDQEMLSSLLDTWDAVGDGHYSTDSEQGGDSGR